MDLDDLNQFWRSLFLHVLHKTLLNLEASSFFLLKYIKTFNLTYLLKLEIDHIYA